MKTYKTTEEQRARATTQYWGNREQKLAYAAEYREKNAEKLRKYFTSEEAKKRKNERRVAWGKANPERQYAANQRMHFKRAYGLTVEQYDAMVAAQGGRCAICDEVPSGKGRYGKLHVDHDHGCGAIRSLLCMVCNQGLGQFRDNPARLRKAAMYVERHSAARHTA